MATRSCPTCGTQYVASVRRCIDCDTMLVDDLDPGAPDDAQGSSAVQVGDSGQIAYELDGWGNQLKVTLAGMLDLAGVVHVWEAGALVVSGEFEEEVDNLIAVVEGADVPELDDEAPQIAFEIEGIDADELVVLDARLIADGIAHAWSEAGELLVAEADESVVSAIIDEVIAGVDEGAGADDGPPITEVLSDLYVAVDRLMKKVHDKKLAAAVARAAEAIDASRVPYGLSRTDWAGLVDEIEALVAALGRAVAFEGDVPDRIALAEDIEADAAAAAELDAEDAPADDEGNVADEEGDEGSDTDEGDAAADDEAPAGDDLSVAERAETLRNRLLAFI